MLNQKVHSLQELDRLVNAFTLNSQVDGYHPEF